MHDLIEEMGKDVVYQESPDEPGERSRMWSEEDVDDVLTNNTGTSKVRGIQVPWRSSTISLNAKNFSEMKNLRYICMGKNLKYESFSGDINYLSNHLRWLDWPDSPLQSFQSDFHANKLVKLNIPNSRRITRLWEGRKNFLRLTCMNLRGCTSLKELPNFSGIPNLKVLDLYECTSLVEVPDSVGLLDKLVTLNAGHCSNLIMFPRKINLRYVETISVSYCKLENFSEVGEEMGSLRSLYLSGTCIKELHPSITKRIGLEELILKDSQNLTFLPYNIYELRNLKLLDVSGCSKLATFPEIPIKMDSLRLLSLSGTCIKELHLSVTLLTGLEVLKLRNCGNLTTLPCNIYEFQNLKFLDASYCPKLTTFPEIPKKMDSLRTLFLRGSDIRELDQSIGNLTGLQILDLEGCKNLTTLRCSIYGGLQNLAKLYLYNCSKLARFPTNTKMLNVDGCSLSLPKLQEFSVKGCGLSDCDFLMTLDCRKTLNWLGLSFNNIVSVPACITKFVNLRWLYLNGCKRLREIPELPLNVQAHISGCESLEERLWTLTDPGAVIRAALLSRHRRQLSGCESLEEPTPSSWLSETPKRHRSAEEPTPSSTCDMWWSPLAQIFQTSNWQANLDPLPNSQSTLANLQSTSPSTPEFQR
ncbi:hypothetical protein ABKV19_025146 [Rosa sericea]